MKKFFIIIFLLFIIAVVGAFAYLLTLDVDQYKDLLVEKIEDAIKKDVRIGNISLDLLPGLAFRIDGASVKEADKDWSDALLKVASIEANVRVLPLLKKDIEIEHVHIIGLDASIAEDSPIGLPEAAGMDKDGRNAGLAATGALKFLAKSISITDSSVSYIGAPSGSKANIQLDIIDATLKNISLYGPVHIDARLSVFGRGRENIKLKAVLYPELETKTSYIKNIELDVNLARLDLTGALNVLGKGDLAQQFIGKELSGELAVSSEKVYLDPKKIYDSNVYVKLSNGKTDMLPVKDSLKDMELRAEMNKGGVTIEKLTGQIAGGNVSVAGSIKNLVSRQDSDLEVILQDIDVATLLPDSAPGEPHFEGRMNIEAKSEGRGLALQKILDTIKVKGDLKLDRAVLKNMNLLTVALDKLNMLPGLVRELKTDLPERYQELLRQDHTDFNPVETNFNLKDRKLSFQKLTIESEAFYLVGQGYLGLDRTLNMHASLFIPQDLSEAFIDEVYELEYLQNADGMITMPVDISGKLPDISVKPDLDYVIQRLAVSKGQELLESIFRKDEPREAEDKPDAEPGSEGQDNQGQGKSKKPKEVDIEEVIIKTIFDIIAAPQDTKPE